MSGKSIDLTRVNIDPKSLGWMTVAFIAVILAWGVANWGADKVKGLGQKAGPVDPFA